MTTAMTIVGLAAILVAWRGWAAWLAYRRRVKRLDARLALAREETARVRVVIQFAASRRSSFGLWDS